MITIRPAAQQDLPRLREIYLHVRSQTFSWINPASLSLSDFDRDTQGESILVAYLDDCLVGFVAVWEPDRFIHHLYVDTQFHNQGAGRQLVHEMINQFGLPVQLKCLVSNTHAMRFYKNLGFITAGQGSDESGDYELLELNSWTVSEK